MSEVIVECSKVAMSHVVGKGGSTIKQIQSDTGCKLETKVDEEDDKKATITISGPDDDSIAKAKEQVQKIIDEQADPDYEGPEGKRLRAEADAHGEERSRLKKEADEHFAADRKDEGHACMKRFKEEGEKMHEASKKAARVILEHRNGGKGRGYLDLHGLRVAEAEEFTNERLDELVKLEEGTELELIPGAGHHSAPGKVALKPAMEKLLKERNIEYEEISAGSFMVHVLGTKGERGTVAAAAVVATDDDGETKPDEETKKGDATEEKKENKDDKKEDEKKDEKKQEKEKKDSCCIIQ